jgi:radical SAM superfamily enzyme YgiQ (UPF0313 family)
VPNKREKVLIVTGGFLSHHETSVHEALRKFFLQWKYSEAAWLDLKVKCVWAEPRISSLLEKRRLREYGEAERKQLEEFLSPDETLNSPSLTEVVLSTLLTQQSMDFAVTTCGELLCNVQKRDELLEDCTCIFISTTLLRDLSEVEPIVKLVKKPHNRIVLGGPLATVLARDWQGFPGVDVLAVGYGEMLVESLVAWIRSDYSDLKAPLGGRVAPRGHWNILHSGVPSTRNLDFLITPDWKHASKLHGRPFRVVEYESVRGCPYRCAFCNYPYLFADGVFRYKSAEKIAEDWEKYVKDMGVEVISCLDSLFTVPKERLRRLCKLLIDRNIKVKWICYARADDLTDEETVAMMKNAGCCQVQIGLESGDQGMLDNMNKKSTVENNRQAIVNCRKMGITTFVTLIVGYPGETSETLEATYQHMLTCRPDFHYAAIFSTRVAGVPVLSESNRERFGLTASNNLHTLAPYWAHNTMSCAEVGNHARILNRRLAENRVSLDASVFYGNLLSYDSNLRPLLLDFQYRFTVRHHSMRLLFDGLNRFMDVGLRRDVSRWLRSETPLTIKKEPTMPSLEKDHAITL